MQILVDGCCGQIGTNLTLHLLKEGNKVVGIDNFLTGDRDNLEVLKENPNFTFFEVAIEDPELKNKLAPYKFEEIYHLACPTGVPNLVTLAEEMLTATSLGTKNILEIAREHKAKVLVASSSETYGDPEIPVQGETYTGNVDPIGMRSPYEEGKRFTEALAIAFFRKYGLDVKIVRIFNTFGPYMSKKDLRVIPQFVDQAAQGKTLTVHGKGEQKRTFLYIEDFLDGVILVLRKGETGQVYNIGSDSQISMLELAKLVLEVTGSKSEIGFVERPVHDHQNRMPELTKIKALGWAPKFTLEDGLKATYQPQFSLEASQK